MIGGTLPWVAIFRQPEARDDAYIMGKARSRSPAVVSKEVKAQDERFIICEALALATAADMFAALPVRATG